MKSFFSLQFRYWLAGLLVIGLFVGCTPAQEDETVQSTATAVAIEPTIAPTETAVPQPETSVELDAFIAQLQTAVTGQDYAAMQSLMSDPIGVGPWRSQWQSLTPDQMAGQFQNNAIPVPLSVQFSGLSLDEITNLLGGQPVEEMLGPDANVAAVLHSSGWGQSTSDDALLFVTEVDGRYFWSAFLYTNGRFADANLGMTAAPAGLIYIVWNEGIYQVQADGFHRQIADAATASIPNLKVSPDGRTIAYFNDDQELWLINNATGNQQQLAGDVTLSGYLLWGDNDTLFTGVWLDPSEADGPNNGHIATLDVNSGSLQILDEERLSGNRPALLSDYNWAAFAVFPASQDDITTGRLYHPDSGLKTFDQTAYAGNTGNPIGNPAWSPDPGKIAWLSFAGERNVVQVFDVEAKTAITIFDWDPARFGALIPSPIWSPDGQWLLLEVWANGPEGSGVWLLTPDGSSQTLIDGQGKEPYWADENQIVFGVNDGPRLYDLTTGEMFKLELPAGSWQLGVTPLDDLLAFPDFIDVDETLENGDTQPGGTADTNLPDPDELTMMVEQFPSPDGRFQATLSQSEPVVVNGSDQFYTSLVVEDGTTSWNPIDEWRGYGLGYVYPIIQGWSDDGRYLFYSNITSFDGCMIFNSGMDLHRLDVANGRTDLLLDTGLTNNLALSPDESQIAYTQFNGQDVVVVLRDAATGKEQSVAVTTAAADAQSGNILWSPDGSFFLLAVAHNPCSADWTHSIVRVDVTRGGLTAVTLIEEDERQFTILEWLDAAQGAARLKDKDGSVWLLDVNSGELAQEE